MIAHISITLREVISRLALRNLYVCRRFNGINYFSFFLSTVAPFVATRCDATSALGENNFLSRVIVPCAHAGLIVAQRSIPGYGICFLVSRRTRKLLLLYPNGIIICISRDMVSNFKRWCSRAALYRRACTSCLRGSVSYDCRQAMATWVGGCSSKLDSHTLTTISQSPPGGI